MPAGSPEGGQFAPKDIQPSSKFFKQDALDYPPSFRATPSKIVSVKLSQLVPTQETLNMIDVRKMAKGEKKFSVHGIDVIKNGDKYVVMDGHHRIAAQIMRGQHIIVVDMIGDTGK